MCTPHRLGGLLRPDALELQRWADRLDCRATLPELVRRLVHATTSELIEVDFPAGEGTGRPGLDGLVRTTMGSAFVPRGASIWEMGCTLDPKQKADGDYRKRSSTTPPGVVPSETTFVFVTPRRWDGKSTWAEERRREGHWRDVLAFDSSNLEQWLDQANGPRLWLSRRLGLPSDALDLEAFWTEWSLQTKPKTPSALLLAGRDEAIDHLWRWISGSPSALPVDCRDPGEAAAFLHAVLGLAEVAIRRKWLDKALVVRSDADLRQVSAHDRGSLVVALGCGIDTARAAADRGHHVLLGGVPDPRREQLVLGPLERPRVSAVLESLGFGEEEASRWSRETGGDLVSIRRLLGAATTSIPADLVPLLLMPFVDLANASDRRALLRVVDRPEAEVLELLRRHSAGPNNPIKRDGDTYRWMSHLDAWRELAGRLTPTDLRRFTEVAVEILTESDPQFRAYSPGLREGMLRSAVLCGAEAAALQDQTTGPDAARRIVFSVLRACTSFERLAAVRNDLPLLAEADPIVFIRELTDLIENQRVPIEELFAASGNGWGDADYTNGLILALETLAWSPDYLSRASLLLAELAEVESEFGNLGGRCLRSLREVYLWWYPHTTATLSIRLAALRALVRRHPDVGYRLILKLLPSNGRESSFGTRRPAWRSWLGSWHLGGNPSEQQGMLESIWEMAVEGVEFDATRWPLLLPKLPQLSRDVQFPRALTALDAVARGQLTTEAQASLWAALRTELHAHRRFPQAKWALEEDQLKPLALAYERLSPDTVLERVAWLFQQRAELPEFYGHDWRAAQDALAKARHDAVKAVLEAAGEASILELARVAAMHGDVARHAVDLGGETLAMELLNRLSKTEEPWCREFRAGLGASLAQRADGALPPIPLDGIKTLQRAQVALGYPFRQATWDQVAAWGSEAQTEYWKWARPMLHEPSADELHQAVNHLLNARRPLDAVELLAMQLNGAKAWGALTPMDTVRSLQGVVELQCQDRPIGTMDAYYAGQLLDFLDAHGEEWRSELSSLEWKWFGVLQDTREPKLLHHKLSNEPHFFVHLLSMVYREEGTEAQEADEQTTTLATQAWRVLSGWERLPGTEESSVDETAFHDWLEQARRLATNAGRRRVADHAIGQALARSPVGRDGNWPHECVRTFFEVAKPFSDLRKGFITGRLNARGVWMKSLGEGGRQERDLATFYRLEASTFRDSWPVTAEVLDEMASRYDGEARHEDLRGARNRDAFIWAASTSDRLRVWVDSSLAEGVFAAELSGVRAFLKVQDHEMQDSIEQLVEDGRVTIREDGTLELLPLGPSSTSKQD